MESHDSLPYVDADSTQSESDAANRLIQKELSRDFKTQLHPSLQPLQEPKYTEIMQKEIFRCAAGEPRHGGIDSSRYEAPEEPSSDADIDNWKQALKTAYISSTYLSGRRTNLTLLEEFGKNAWLIGNAQLEGTLKAWETELAGLKAQIDEVNKARKIAQEGSRGELTALEDTWKKGIGNIIEVQVATEQLRDELSQRRRVATRSERHLDILALVDLTLLRSKSARQQAHVDLRQTKALERHKVARAWKSQRLTESTNGLVNLEATQSKSFRAPS